MTEIAPGIVAKELERARGEASKDGTFSSGRNIIFFHNTSFEIEPLLSTFIGGAPARVFVVSEGGNSPKGSVTVSAQCHSLGAEQKVCSEIVQLQVPLALFKSIPSIIRGNSLTGRPTEAVLLDTVTSNPILRDFFDSIETLYIDSINLDHGLSFISEVLADDIKVVDVNWIRLSVWRAALKDLFERDLRKIYSIQSVRITGSTEVVSGKDSAAFLLGGWFRSKLGKDVVVTIEAAADTSQTTGISRVDIISKSGDTLGSVSMTPPMESAQTLLTRHFLIGESFINYGSSVCYGLGISHAH